MRKGFILALFLLVFTAPHAGQTRQFADDTASVHILPVRTFDVEHYKIELTLDYPDKRIAGQVTIRLHPLQEGFKEVALDSINLRISRAMINGREASFQVRPDKLVVALDRSYSPSEHLDVAVDYSGSPRQGLYWVGNDPAYPNTPAQIWSQGEDRDSRFWFPCYDFPNDKATTETLITVKKPFTVVSNGSLIDVTDKRDTRTFHWRLDRPHSTYLTSIAVGDFEEYKESAGKVAIEYYVPKGTGRERALRAFGETPRVLQFFETLTGVPYPYKRYAQVAVANFIFGGMENITATTQTLDILHEARADQDYPSRHLVTHELSHQWWGDLITAGDWPDMWLNEGFATYFETLYTRKADGEDAFRYALYENSQDYFQEDATEYRRPIVFPVYTEPGDLFDQHMYSKASLVLHMIHNQLGDDLFFKSLRAYAAKFGDGNASTDDFRRVLEETTGRDFKKFFQQWFYRAGFPEYSVSSTWRDGAMELSVRQTQRVDDLTPLFDMPVVVDFTFADGSVESREIRIDKAEQSMVFPLRDRPVMVRFDPGNHILKKLEFQKSQEELQYQAAKDPDVIGRMAAIEHLAPYSTDPTVLAVLVAALRKDPFFGVRAAAAEALSLVKNDAVMNELINAALHDANSKVRTAAVSSLGELGDDPRSVAAIIRVLNVDSSYAAESAAAAALARTRDARASETLRTALTKASYREIVRRSALAALVEISDPASMRLTLLDWTVYGKPPEARATAIALLPRVAASDRAEIVNRLRSLLQDPWIFAREAAIVALGRLRATEAADELTTSAVNEPDSRLRKEARLALAAMGIDAAAASVKQ